MPVCARPVPRGLQFMYTADAVCRKGHFPQSILPGPSDQPLRQLLFIALYHARLVLSSRRPICAAGPASSEKLGILLGVERR